MNPKDTTDPLWRKLTSRKTFASECRIKVSVFMDRLPDFQFTDSDHDHIFIPCSKRWKKVWMLQRYKFNAFARLHWGLDKYLHSQVYNLVQSYSYTIPVHIFKSSLRIEISLAQYVQNLTSMLGRFSKSSNMFSISAVSMVKSAAFTTFESSSQGLQGGLFRYCCHLYKCYCKDSCGLATTWETQKSRSLLS